jgi:hypothetical protein
VVGTELRFKTIRGVAKWRGHDSGIGDHHIEQFAFGQQSIGAGSRAFEIGKIKLNELEAATVGCIFADLNSRGFSFRQVSYCAHNVRAVCRQSARSFNSDPSRNTGNKNPFAAQIDVGENIIRG